MVEREADPQRLLGDFICAQRQLANLSLRRLSAMTEASNPYLSQIERGLHEPSVRVLTSIANALDLSAETLLVQAGLISETQCSSDDDATEPAIRIDPRLTHAQRQALLGVYRNDVETNAHHAS